METTVRERVQLAASPEVVFAYLTTEEGFLSFRGFGPIPGLRAVHFDRGDYRSVGSSAKVTNSDGSTHRETVLAYEPPHRYAMRIDSISSPFRLLMDHGEETWRLSTTSGGTTLERTFRFVLRSVVGAPLAVPIAQLFFRLAIRRHHADLRAHMQRQPRAA